jgi:hypothetical protein
MIDKGNIPSIQYKMSLRGPKSLRKVDGLSLRFIDFYVPAFSPRLISTETSLQLSENVTIFVDFLTSNKSQSHIAIDGQSVSLGVEPHLGLMSRYLLHFDNYGLVFVGRSL